MDKGSCRYDTYSMKYYCECSEILEGSQCNFQNRTDVYYMQEINANISLEYQKLFDGEYDFEYLKLASQYKDLMNDTSLYRLTDILKASLVKLQLRTVPKAEIQ